MPLPRNVLATFCHAVFRILPLAAGIAWSQTSVELIDSGTSREVTGATQATVVSDIPFLDVRDNARVTIEDGASVSHLDASDHATVIIKQGAEVSHATGLGMAHLEIRGKVSSLQLENTASAILDGASIEGGGYAGSFLAPVSIVLSVGSRLDIYATDTRFHDGIFQGWWRDGRRFEFGVGWNLGTAESPRYEDVDAWPEQVRSTELSDASFDCTKARSIVEKMICGSTELAIRDRRLNAHFSSAIEMTAPERVGRLRRTQRGWLTRRNACRATDCIEKAYDDRSRELAAFTGNFDERFGRALCSALAEPAKRLALLQETAGTEDVNNDGRAEQEESCWGGSMNTPCSEFKDADGGELPITQDGFEWKDYWTYGEQRFRYDGKTFFYHSRDDGLTQPSYVSYVSYVTPQNVERVVCDFSNVITPALRSGEAPVCAAIERGDSMETIVGSPVYGPDAPTVQRRETGVKSVLSVDIDNDGDAERIVELAYSSGAGRGCDDNYFELLSSDGLRLEDDSKGALVRELHGDSQGGRSCGSISNRLIRYLGKIYLESNVHDSDTAQHALRILEEGRVQTVCTFAPKVHTSIHSLR